MKRTQQMKRTQWLLVALAVLALTGALTLLLRDETLKRLIRPLVAFSAGSLLGGAFFHMMPEAVAQQAGPVRPFVWLMLGFGVFFALLLFGLLYEWKKGAFEWD